MQTQEVEIAARLVDGLSAGFEDIGRLYLQLLQEQGLPPRGVYQGFFVVVAALQAAALIPFLRSD